MARRTTKDNPLQSLAGERLGNATGQAKRFVNTALQYRNEAVSVMRKRTGRATTTIRIARPTHRGRIINGKFVWENLVELAG